MPHNPFARWRMSNDWAGHLSYSLGGEDYPTTYGFAFHAPAAGILRSSGGSGEWAAGWIGTAGRRSILSLDHPIGDAVAVVFQHQSAFGREGHYDEGDPNCGYTGASASGKDWGGDVHMHVHCLTATGRRVPFTTYFGTTTTAALAVDPITEEDIMRGMYIWTQNRGGALVDLATGGVPLAGEEATVALSIYGPGPELNDRQWDVAVNLANRLAERNAALVADALAVRLTAK